MAKEKLEAEVLTTQDDPKDKTIDEKTNLFGTDAPTVQKPKEEPKPAPKAPAPKRDETADMKTAIKYLAGKYLSAPDFEEFQRAFPGMFE